MSEQQLKQYDQCPQQIYYKNNKVVTSKEIQSGSYKLNQLLSIPIEYLYQNSFYNLLQQDHNMAWQLINLFGISMFAQNYNENYQEQKIQFQQYKEQQEQRGISLIDFDNVRSRILDLSNQNINDLESLAISQDFIVVPFEQVDFSMNPLTLQQIDVFIKKFTCIKAIYIDQIKQYSYQELLQFIKDHQNIKIYTFSMNNKQFLTYVNKQLIEITIQQIDLEEIPVLIQFLNEQKQKIEKVVVQQAYYTKELNQQQLDNINKLCKTDNYQFIINNLIAKVDKDIDISLYNTEDEKNYQIVINNINDLPTQNFLQNNQITQNYFNDTCKLIQSLVFKYSIFDNKQNHLIIYDTPILFSEYSFNKIDPNYAPNCKLINRDDQLYIEIKNNIPQNKNLILDVCDKQTQKLFLQVQHNYNNINKIQYNQQLIIIERDEESQKNLLKVIENFNMNLCYYLTSNGLRLNNIDEAQFYLMNNLIEFYVIFVELKQETQALFYYIKEDKTIEIIFSQVYQNSERLGQQINIQPEIQQSFQTGNYIMQIDEKVGIVY